METNFREMSEQVKGGLKGFAGSELSAQADSGILFAYFTLTQLTENKTLSLGPNG